jgi:hypothetical protein
MSVIKVRDRYFRIVGETSEDVELQCISKQLAQDLELAQRGMAALFPANGIYLGGE